MWFVVREVVCGSIEALRLAFIRSRLFLSLCSLMYVCFLVWVRSGVERISASREGTYVVKGGGGGMGLS